MENKTQSLIGEQQIISKAGTLDLYRVLPMVIQLLERRREYAQTSSESGVYMTTINYLNRDICQLLAIPFELDLDKAYSLEQPEATK